MREVQFYRYFFAFRPSPLARTLILEAAAAWGIVIPDRQAEQFHLTLCVIAELLERDLFLAARADSVVGNADLSSCRINLGRLQAGTNGAILRSLGRQDDVRGFYAALIRLIAQRNLHPLHRKSGLNAHLTLNHVKMAKRTDVAPVAWCPDELLLIESHVGAGRHEVLRCWPLLPPPQGELDFGIGNVAASWRQAA